MLTRLQVEFVFVKIIFPFGRCKSSAGGDVYRTISARRSRGGALVGCGLIFSCLPARHAQAQNTPQDVLVVGQTKPSIQLPAGKLPAGETAYGASRATFSATPEQSVTDMLATVPGVSFNGGSGPRDVAISVRGSDDRNVAGLRNVQVLEDGFPLTQPDGMARSDLIDPHAYASVDVVQGPSSTLFGDYAVDGAILFRTRDGAEIPGGLELGSDFGSYGRFNQYVTAGTAGRGYDFMIFGSDLRGDGFIANSQYDTSTENAKLRINLSPQDRLILKVVNNVTDTSLPLRLSLNQYGLNPLQKGCLPLRQSGCGSVKLFRNGAYGSTTQVSAAAAGLGRFDRRTVAGLRWEHDLDAETLLRTQFTFDERALDQPTGSTSNRGVFDSYNVSSDIAGHGQLFGLPLTSFGGVNFDYLNVATRFLNITPQGGATLGSLVQSTFGHQWNAGARFQEEVQLAPQWRFVMGLGGEYSDLGATETILTPSAAGTARRFITANRFYFNLAPEGALIWKPKSSWTVHARVASGYGTPATTNLFTTPQGTFGNNTQLKSQSNDGIDLGVQWQPGPELSLQATGFYEFFSDEQITQSAGVNLQNYTFNVPASQHRGVELGADWVPLPAALPGGRVLLSYTYDNQIFTRYNEVVTGNVSAARFDRNGNTIPGVVPNVLDVRLIYTRPSGVLEGVGGFFEFNYQDGFWLDNANLLKAPGFGLLNLELHYDPPVRMKLLHRFHVFFEAQNLANRTYVASASNVSDSLTSSGSEAGAATLATKTGSIFAGAPRSFFGGVRLLF